MTSSFSATLNTGSVYGSGRTGYASATSTASGNAALTGKVANSTVISRISRDISAGYSSDISKINAYVEAGNYDKALKEYEKLEKAIQTSTNEYGYTLTDGQVESILSSAYQKNTGNNITSQISGKTTGSFGTGVLEGLPIIGLFFNEYSTEEVLAKTSGDKVELKDKLAEGAGVLVGGATVGAAVGLFGGPIGAVGGAAIGAGVGAVQILLKTIF